MACRRHILICAPHLSHTQWSGGSGHVAGMTEAHTLHSSIRRAPGRLGCTHARARAVWTGEPLKEHGTGRHSHDNEVSKAFFFFHFPWESGSLRRGGLIDFANGKLVTVSRGAGQAEAGSPCCVSILFCLSAFSKWTDPAGSARLTTGSGRAGQAG